MSESKILERDYICRVCGRWYRLEVARAHEPSCYGCAFCDCRKATPDICTVPHNVVTFAANTCCDCGKGYNAVWKPYTLPAVEWVTAGWLCNYLDGFVTVWGKGVEARALGQLFRRRGLAYEYHEPYHRQKSYRLREAMDCLWEEGYFETVVNDLNTPYRTDRRR